jgi:hypothetical protein
MLAAGVGVVVEVGRALPAHLIGSACTLVVVVAVGPLSCRV